MRRIGAALAARDGLAGSTDTTAYRLIHGEADGLPGLAVDRLADVLVLHTSDESAGAEQISAALPGLIPEAQALYQKHHPRQPHRLTPAERDALAPATPSWGQARDRVQVQERGIQYEVRPGAGLSYGLFLDMRDVRAWVKAQAAGREVLNLFAYTCAFGVSAMLGGATRVLNVDLSKPYLDWGKRNYALNQLDARAGDFVYGDATDWLARFARRGDQFDLVILDPPSFSTSGGHAYAAEQGYSNLVAAAARCTRQHGILLAAMNHARTSPARFRSLVAAGLAAAGREARVLRRWHEPLPDFPVAAGQAPYLKVVALQMGER